MRQLAISTGDAFILVYGVDDEASFEQVERLRDQIVAEKDGDDRTPIVIVGNKTDLDGDRRRVDQPTAETTASIDWGTGYVEVGLSSQYLYSPSNAINNNKSRRKRNSNKLN